MFRGLPTPATAFRLVRLLLPLCLLVATAVAVLGLLRVVRQPAAKPQSDSSPSLRLGSPSARAPDAPDARVAQATRHPPAAASPHRTAPAQVTGPVVVINASGITGLADRTATVLRQRGVSIASIGNLGADRRPDTRTVFYPPGGRGQAQALATLAGAPAVAPAPTWLRAGGRLVLVVTDASTSFSS